MNSAESKSASALIAVPDQPTEAQVKAIALECDVIDWIFQDSTENTAYYLGRAKLNQRERDFALKYWSTSRSQMTREEFIKHVESHRNLHSSNGADVIQSNNATLDRILRVFT